MLFCAVIQSLDLERLRTVLKILRPDSYSTRKRILESERNFEKKEVVSSGAAAAPFLAGDHRAGVVVFNEEDEVHLHVLQFFRNV